MDWKLQCEDFYPVDVDPDEEEESTDEIPF